MRTLYIGIVASAVNRNIVPIASGLTVNSGTPPFLIGSFNYFDANADIRKTPVPYITELSISGTLNINTQQLPAYIYNNLSNISEGTSLFKWYEADDLAGSNETIVSTLSGYTPSNSSKKLDLGIIPVSMDSTQGLLTRFGYVNLMNSFNPFTDISWDIAINFSTGGTTNFGTAGNAVASVSAPIYDSIQRSFRFIKLLNQNFKSQSALAYTTPVTFWFQFKTPSGFTGTQYLGAASNTHKIAFVGSQLQLSNTNTGVNLSTNTWYTLQWILNGVISEYAITPTGSSMGNTTSISLSTSSIGTPNVRIGSDFGDANTFNGWIRYPFILRGSLSFGQIINMKTYLNVL
jgi:hypothetical protein